MDIDTQDEFVCDNNFITLLNKIYLTTDRGLLRKTVANSAYIPSLLDYLYSTKQTNQQIQIINFLTFNFRQLPINIHILTRALDTSTSKSLHDILIDLYLLQIPNQEESDLLRTSILDCLQELVINSGTNRRTLEFLYSKLSVHFRDQPIDRPTIVSHLKLLRTLYGERLSSPRPGCYFFFSGRDGLGVDDTILRSEKIKVNQGCLLFLWFKCLLDPVEDAEIHHHSELVHMLCSKKQSLIVSLSNHSRVAVTASSEECSKIIPTREWVWLCILVKPKSFLRSPELLLFINNEAPVKLTLNTFSLETEILELSFFNRFVGKSTSVMMCNKAVSEEHVKVLQNELHNYPHGIWKEKKLYHMLKGANEKYMSTSNTTNTTNTTNTAHTVHSNTNTNIPYKSCHIQSSTSEMWNAVIDGLKLFYVPFRCDSDTVEDLCGKYHGRLSSSGGVHMFNRSIKNVRSIGGMNSTLPIIELMAQHRLLDEDILVEYLRLLHVLVDYRKSNMVDALETDFFQSLSLFMEKMPRRSYGAQTLEVLLDIGKSLFTCVDDIRLCGVYFENILLNERIFIKFDYYTQMRMWDSLRQFYVSDVSQIKHFIPMSKVCFILRHYDQSRYTELCCVDHSNYFIKRCSVMQPELKERISDLMSIVQMVVDMNSDELLCLVKLLTLDLSPCLQKCIIDVLVNYFSSNKPDRHSTLMTLIGNSFIDICLYVLSISLLDVRHDILRLFVLLSSCSELSEIFKSNVEERIFPFLRENLLPNIEPKRNEEKQRSKSIQLISCQMSKPGDTPDKCLSDKKDSLTSEAEYFLKRDSSGSHEIKLFQLNPIKKGDRVKWVDKLDKTNPESNQSSPLVKSFSTSRKPSRNFKLDLEKIKLEEGSPRYREGDTMPLELFRKIKSPGESSGDIADIFEINPVSRRISDNAFKHLVPPSDVIQEVSEVISPLKKEEEETEEDNIVIYDKNSAQDEITQIARTRSTFYTTIRKSELKLNFRIYDMNYFNSQLESIYDILFRWLTTDRQERRKFSSSVIERDNYDNEIITRPQLIDVLFNLIKHSGPKLMLKFLQDIHLILHNKENCIILYSNQSFYTWLVESLYDNYQTRLDEDHLSSGSTVSPAFELGKKIHTELIIKNTLYGSDKTEPVEKISYILTQGVNYRLSMNMNEISDLLRELIGDVLSQLAKLATKSATCVTNTNWINFMNCSVLTYEFITFYNFTEFTIESTINVPRWIIKNGLNWNHNKSNTISSSSPSPSLEHTWKDYKLFKTVYTPLSRIWNKFYDQLNLNSTPLKTVEDILDNSKDTYIEELKLLYSGGVTYEIPMMKVIHNLLSVTVAGVQSGEEAKFWLLEYEKFLLFLIVSTSNLSPTGSEFYSGVQQMTLDIISFSIGFLCDELYNGDMNSDMDKYYSKCIRSVFTVLVVVLHHIHHSCDKKKKTLMSLLTLGKKNDLTKSAVYILFEEFILSKEGEPLVNSSTVGDIIQSGFIEIPEMFNNEYWRYALTDNPKIKKRVTKLFDFVLYETVSKERMDVTKSRLDSVSKDKPILSLSFSPTRTPVSLRQSVNRTIENVIPHFEKEIRKYNNLTYINQIKKKKNYRKLKKKLFTWRGMWVDDELFYKESYRLKLRTVNHYASNFTRPILMPILDLDYYLPEFTHFNKLQLFRGEVTYRINMNLDEILQGMSKEDDNRLNFSDTSPRNDLNCIYQDHNQFIWRLYNDLNLDFSKEPKYHLEHMSKPNTLSLFRLNSQDHLMKYDHHYECCLVKQTHHIKGILTLSVENGMTFRVHRKEPDNKLSSSLGFQKTNSRETDREEDYDQDRNTCFGSYFVSHYKDEDTFSYHLDYKEIAFLFKRRYYYRKTGLEIFTRYNRSYYFNFRTSSDRDQLMKGILSFIENRREIRIGTGTKEAKDNTFSRDTFKDDSPVIGYEILNYKPQTKYDFIQKKIESWMNWQISNLEMVTWLNILSNRSYTDLSQYPVFPWIITQYSSVSMPGKEHIRDMSLPMGMLELNERGRERKQLYMEYYRGLKSDNEGMEIQPHCYGSHYSNPIYVSHYMTRIFPYASTMIELQGDKFDDPNRLFISISNSFDCASTQKGDVRELIPEFFILPEMFRNLNNLNLGVRTDIHKQKHHVDDVLLPDWASSNPYEFVTKHRMYLESEEVSSRISEWVDLIFGYKQKGKEAESVYNLFIPSSYEDSVNIEVLGTESLLHADG